ncbi:hypothetical protein COLO4_07576 [Corchorus olitorius]|uniref:F-box domain-containing protein n=1 Tax=Corchorus olitorius TaxID=93759 RepID=A0A1R3KJE3_9ROSI|nr:hypothetical protein COLO4_07576 [Corchorus olitorius]
MVEVFIFNSAAMGNMSTAMDNMRLDPADASPSATDRISELPEDVMNRILFLLPPKEAARTSILSKNWLNQWNSLPIFNLCTKSLPGRNNLLKEDCPNFGANVDEYLNHIDKSLQKVRDHKVLIGKFELDLFLCEEKHTLRINKFIELATKNCVKELILHTFLHYPYPQPSLPLAIFETCSFTVLDLGSWDLMPAFSKLENYPKFPCLRELSLSHVNLEEKILQNLLACCPMIERFALKYCWSVKHILLRNLPKLKIAFIMGPRKVEILEGVNIQELECFSSMNTPLVLRLVCFDYLKTLRLSTVFTEQNIQGLIDNSPHLHTLILSPTNTLERLKFSSHQLRHLHLDNLYHFGQVEIDAPNLRHFLCYINGGELHNDNPFPSSILVATTRPLKAQFCVFGNYPLTNQSFHNLRKYFQLFQYNAAVYINGFLDVNDSIVAQLGDNPAAHLDRLELKYSSSLFDYAAVLDYFLMLFRPIEISVTAIEESSTEFTKFLLVKFLTREENPVCCSNCRVKCWRHYLENVKIRSLSRSVEPDQEVVFTLNWMKYI